MNRTPALIVTTLCLVSTLSAVAASADGLAQQGKPHAAAPASARKPVMQVYKSPTCGCCKEWVEHVKAAGFDARVTDLPQDELDARKAKLGVGARLQSCHTAVVNGYVVEGHVPADDIWRMLKERPAIAGIAAPGMPAGSPGMEMPSGRKDRYDVVSFDKRGSTAVYASH